MHERLIDLIKSERCIVFKEGSLTIYRDFGKMVHLPRKYVFPETEEDAEILDYYFKLVQTSNKSQEEIAAEEAVRKSKESLKAAEETLKKIKEKQ